MSFMPQRSIIYPQTSTMKVSGLTRECLYNLRRGDSHSKTHLLGFMSEFIEDNEQIKLQEVDELCCYDRMKKLLIKNDDSKQQRKQNQNTLLKAMQIEAKMNCLEKELQQKVTMSQKGNSNSKNYQQKQNQLSMSCSNSKSLMMTENSSTINMGNYNNTSSVPNPSPTSTLHTSTNNLLTKKSKTQHIPYKSGMLQRLRQRGYQKFFEFQRIKKQTNMQKIKQMMGEQIENKFNKVIEDKDTQKRKLKEENKLLQRKLLEKNLELETLRQENVYLKDNVKELEEKIFGTSNQIQNAHLIKSYEKWLNQYKEQFGEMSITELSRYIEQIKSKCLQRFNEIENKKEEKIIQIGNANQERFMKLKKEMEKLQVRENYLLDVNRNLKLNKEISQLEINQLLRSKSELSSLRELIVSVYSQWYQKRTQNQKQVMKSLNKLKENYSYEDMLNYMLFYDSKLSTNDKLNEYILKVLRGIQKIRKTIYPIQSNDRLDPFIVLDQIALWVQKQLKKEQQFMANSSGNMSVNGVANSANNPTNNNSKLNAKLLKKNQLINESYLVQNTNN